MLPHNHLPIAAISRLLPAWDPWVLLLRHQQVRITLTIRQILTMMLIILIKVVKMSILVEVVEAAPSVADTLVVTPSHFQKQRRLQSLQNRSAVPQPSSSPDLAAQTHKRCIKIPLLHHPPARQSLLFRTTATTIMAVPQEVVVVMAVARAWQVEMAEEVMLLVVVLAVSNSLHHKLQTMQ